MSCRVESPRAALTAHRPDPAKSRHRVETVTASLLDIYADGDVASRQFGKGSCMCVQLRECRVVCYFLLRLAIHFPTGVARDNQPFSGPGASVEPGHPKKFGAMFFKDCLRLLGGLDHFLGLIALKARELRDRRHTVFLAWLVACLFVR